jgi:hypothetical protein
VEFETEATFEAVVDSASLRSARDTVEKEFSDLEVQVDAVAQTNGGGRAGASKERAMGRRLQSEQLDALADIQNGLETAAAPESVVDAWDETHELDERRNELLEEILDENEDGNRLRGRGGGGGRGMLALLGMAAPVGIAGLGLVGLTKALEEFGPDFPESIPLTGVPGEIDVDAPDKIPISSPFPIPIPVAEAVVDVVQATTGSEAPTGTPGGTTTPTPPPTDGTRRDSDSEMTPEEIAESAREQLAGGSDSGSGAGSGEVTPIPPDERLGQDRPDPNADYTLVDDAGQPAESGPLANTRWDEAAGGAGVGIAAWGALEGTGQGLSRGPRASPAGVGAPALPGLFSRSEGGRSILQEILQSGQEASGTSGGAPAMSTSPVAAASLASSESGNRSTTRRTETRVEFNVDARDSRNTQETMQKVRRKVDELERRLRGIESAGQRGGL